MRGSVGAAKQGLAKPSGKQCVTNLNGRRKKDDEVAYMGKIEQTMGKGRIE